MNRRLTLLTESNKGVALWKACMPSFDKLSRELVSYLSATDVAKAVRPLKEMEQRFRQPVELEDQG